MTCKKVLTLKSVLLVLLFSVPVPVPVSAMGWVGQTLDGVLCRGNEQGFGPYDYFDINEKSDRLYQAGRLWEIDRLHTDRAVNLMKAGLNIKQGEFQLAAHNLDYTLRAIPNEPRALQEIVRLHFIKADSSRKLVYEYPPPECYFQRAAAFRPKQAHVPLLHAIYLHKRSLYELAIKQYQKALEVDPNSAEAHYNIGLLYLETDEVEKATDHAKSAYALGYPLPGLRSKLRRLDIKLE